MPLQLDWDLQITTSPTLSLLQFYRMHRKRRNQWHQTQSRTPRPNHSLQLWCSCWRAVKHLCLLECSWSYQSLSPERIIDCCIGVITRVLSWVVANSVHNDDIQGQIETVCFNTSATTTLEIIELLLVTLLLDTLRTRALKLPMWLWLSSCSE